MAALHEADGKVVSVDWAKYRVHIIDETGRHHDLVPMQLLGTNGMDETWREGLEVHLEYHTGSPYSLWYARPKHDCKTCYNAYRKTGKCSLGAEYSCQYTPDTTAPVVNPLGTMTKADLELRRVSATPTATDYVSETVPGLKLWCREEGKQFVWRWELDGKQSLRLPTMKAAIVHILATLNGGEIEVEAKPEPKPYTPPEPMPVQLPKRDHPLCGKSAYLHQGGEEYFAGVVQAVSADEQWYTVQDNLQGWESVQGRTFR